MLSDKLYSNTNSLQVICIFDTNLSTTYTAQSLQVTRRTSKYIKLGNLIKITVIELNENMRQYCIKRGRFYHFLRSLSLLFACRVPESLRFAVFANKMCFHSDRKSVV